MTGQALILTSDIARRIERFIVEGKLLDLPGGTNPAEVGRFGQTVAINSLTHGWMNGVYCFGSDDLPRLGEILAFYDGSAGDSPSTRFHLAPMGFNAEVGERLSAAGFHQAAFEQTELFGRPSPQPAATTPDIAIERVDISNSEVYAELHAQAFAWPAEWREIAKEGLRQRVKRTDIHAFIARWRGEPAAVAVMEVRDGIASLQHGGTPPAFRCHGCQLALIQHRLHLAHQLGCQLIIGGAAFGSTSLRNQLRAGLQIAYIEATWARGAS